MGKVLNVCISEVRGVSKHPVESLHLIPNHGIEGDAHAGNWHRQVSLLAQESVDTLQAKITLKLKSGDFAENVLTQGIDLKSLPVGTRLKMGTAIGEVTQIGKECHADCAIRQQVGDCVMPREGIFVRVLEEGVLKPGDEVEVIV
jgi:MOSC domain-containing protein YiiM